ncbi:MAG: hypothetical protein QM647_17325 [Asticcacaulis sp.]|uniref:hypothetical protein n=1 Tax=Asticcacaulis sp. TaxID=1872648 RepID=UPI0039E4E2DD
MLDDFAIADPAEETLEASGDTDLDLQQLDAGQGASAVFLSPVLDRIRTSD